MRLVLGGLLLTLSCLVTAGCGSDESGGEVRTPEQISAHEQALKANEAPKKTTH